jgi:hypothetical protein
VDELTVLAGTHGSLRFGFIELDPNWAPCKLLHGLKGMEQTSFHLGSAARRVRIR